MKHTYHMTAKDRKGRVLAVDVVIDLDGILQYLANRAANAEVLTCRAKSQQQVARLAGGLAVATVVRNFGREPKNAS